MRLKSTTEEIGLRLSLKISSALVNSESVWFALLLICCECLLSEQWLGCLRVKHVCRLSGALRSVKYVVTHWLSRWLSGVEHVRRWFLSALESELFALWNGRLVYRIGYRPCEIQLGLPLRLIWLLTKDISASRIVCSLHREKILRLGIKSCTWVSNSISRICRLRSKWIRRIGLLNLLKCRCYAASVCLESCCAKGRFDLLLHEFIIIQI